MISEYLDDIVSSTETCFNCNEAGHQFANCPQKHVMACYHCLEESHFASNCPEGGHLGLSGGCFRSGEESHFHCECPNTPASGANCIPIGTGANFAQIKSDYKTALADGLVGRSLKKLNKKLHKLEMWCLIPRPKLQELNLEPATVPVKAKTGPTSSTMEARTTRATPGIGWSPMGVGGQACQL